MAKGLQPIRFLAMCLLVAMASLVGLVLMPHDRYIRFQSMAASSVHYLRAKWVYERIHFDPTPIDVAFIGTSHTQSAIDSALVEKVLRERGHDWKVVNFAIPHLGRDLHYLIVRELLAKRRISRLVVELQEGEARAPHPAFRLLADTSDLLESPVLVNTGYLDNLSRLPERQASLFLRSRAPELFGLNRALRPEDYEGPHWDDTLKIHGISAQRTNVYDAEHFRKPVAKLLQDFESKQALGKKLAPPFMRHRLLYRYNLLYLEDLLQLAKSNGVQIVFLYLPFLNGPEAPVDRELVLDYGPIFTPRDVIDEASFWQNEDHLNVHGARRVSRWIGERLHETAPPAATRRP